MNNIIATARTAFGLASGQAALNPARVAGVAALALGALLIFGVGFAQPDFLHAVAHDGRHAFAFPCH